MIMWIQFDGDGLSLANPYARLIQRSTGKIFKPSDKTLGAATTWADSVITLTFSALLGGTPVILSQEQLNSLTADDYYILIYDNAVPADTDKVKIGGEFTWSGNNVVYNSPSRIKF